MKTEFPRGVGKRGGEGANREGGEEEFWRQHTTQRRHD